MMVHNRCGSTRAHALRSHSKLGTEVLPLCWAMFSQNFRIRAVEPQSVIGR